MKRSFPDFDSTVKKIETLSHGAECGVPSKSAVIDTINKIRFLLFPEYYPELCSLPKKALIEEIYLNLTSEISSALKFSSEPCIDAEKYAVEIIELLPDIKEALMKDVKAIFEGDPAATGSAEIILAYPGFLAISVYRIAHEFYKRKIPILPRLMTEYAHEKTGIDIHAGATIGEYFFIDHGTGIVIGETTTIGDHVKIYQGVTLGAKSFELDENGNPIKGVKRHPDIGNNVIIYANATILGGNTKIGDGAVIGGNVWLTHSVDAGSKIYYKI